MKKILCLFLILLIMSTHTEPTSTLPKSVDKVIIETPIYKEEHIEKQLPSEVYDIPEDIVDICVDVANLYDMNCELLMAVCWVESRCNPTAQSNAGARGIMQVIPKWHKDRMSRLGVTDLFDARQCILVGADYLNDLMQYYSVGEALTVYNTGRCDGEINSYARDVMEVASNIMQLHYI